MPRQKNDTVVQLNVTILKLPWIFKAAIQVLSIMTSLLTMDVPAMSLMVIAIEVNLAANSLIRLLMTTGFKMVTIVSTAVTVVFVTMEE